MGRHAIFVVLALTLVWVVLMERLSWQTAATGMFVSMICVSLSDKFLPFKEITDVNFLKLVTFPFFLIGQIYMAGFHVIGLILTDAKFGIIEVKTNIKSESLGIMLADSITLTPGSVMLKLEDGIITLVCIGRKHASGFPDTVEELRRLEDKLIKAQK